MSRTGQLLTTDQATRKLNVEYMANEATRQPTSETVQKLPAHSPMCGSRSSSTPTGRGGFRRASASNIAFTWRRVRFPTSAEATAFAEAAAFVEATAFAQASAVALVEAGPRIAVALARTTGKPSRIQSLRLSDAGAYPVGCFKTAVSAMSDPVGDRLPD